jgi:hypothetical protein
VTEADVAFVFAFGLVQLDVMESLDQNNTSWQDWDSVSARFVIVLAISNPCQRTFDSVLGTGVERDFKLVR